MKRRPRLRLVVLLLLLCGAGLLGLGLRSVPRLSAVLLARGLSSFFGRTATVGEVRFRLFPLEAEILDLRVSGLTPESPPFLELPRAVAAPALAPLWGRRVVLARLRLFSPRVRIHAFPEGGDDIPRMGAGTGTGLEFRVRRLAIESGEISLDHRRVPVNLDLPEFRGRLARRPDSALAGAVSFGPGSLRFGENPEMRVATDMELSLSGSLLTVESGHLKADSTDLVYAGQIHLAARPRGELELRGPVDLDLLDLHVMRTGFRIKGPARFAGKLSLDGSRLRLKGGMDGDHGEFDGVPVGAFQGQVAWDEGGVHIKDLALRSLGGSGTLQIELPPGQSVARLDAKLEALDAEASLRWIFDLGDLGVGSSATGDVSLRWPRGRFRELSGRVALDLALRPDGRTPLHGRFEWRAEKGVQFVESADLRTLAAAAQLAGRIETDNRMDLSLAGESADLGALDSLLARLRRALGAKDARVAGFSGNGTFHGRLKGSLESPVFEGRLEGQDVGYLGVVWGAAEWNGRLTSERLTTNSLVVSRGKAEIELSGDVETGDYGDRDGADLRARLRSWPAQDLVKAIGWDVKLDGPVSGDVTLRGRRSVSSGVLNLRAPHGTYYGVPFTDLDLSSSMREGVTEVRQGRAIVGGGEVRFSGTLGEDGSYDGKASFRAIEIGELLPGAAGTPRPAGRVSGELVLLGPLDRPRISGSLQSPRLFLGDEGVGALDADFSGSGDGSVAVLGHCRSARVDLDFRGTVGVDRDLTSSLRLAARATSLDPFLRAFAPALPPAVGIVADGEVLIDGPLRDPRKLRMSMTAPTVRVQLPDYPVRNKQPLRLELADGRMLVRDVQLAGEGTDLAVSGIADLIGNGPLDVTVRGAADLRTLSLVTRRLRGQGAARLAMSLKGTRAEPRVDGALVLEGAGVRVRGFPHGLEAVRGSIRFNEASAKVSEVTGSIGGGEVSVEGELGYASGQLTSIDLLASGRSLSLRYPEGLRSTIDAELRLFGDGLRQWLSGSVDVRHALWTQRYDVASELLAARAVREEKASLGEGLRYDIKLHAPGTLEIDNNLTTLHARADLELQGDSEAPVVLGRAEIDRGRVYFQGNTYTIRRGSIDFSNPQRTDPQFDIEAEARIRSYRVTLKVNGTLERVYPTLSSDPPLSAVQIVSLLAGAEDPVVDSLAQSQSEQARLAAAGAATLAAGRISEEVGLERQAERLFGLNRFSIDPTLVRGNVTNPKARLTVGKRLTSDLNVLYSVDLGGTEERLLSVEYTLSDRLSLLLTQSERGVGFDLRLRQTR